MLIKRSENFGPLMVVSLFFVGGLVGESLRTPSKHVTLKKRHRWYIPDFAQPNQPNPLVGFDDLTLHSTRSCGTSRFGICGRQVGWEVCEPRLRPISQRRLGMEAPKIRLGIICLFVFVPFFGSADVRRIYAYIFRIFATAIDCNTIWRDDRHSIIVTISSISQKWKFTFPINPCLIIFDHTCLWHALRSSLYVHHTLKYNIYGLIYVFVFTVLYSQFHSEWRCIFPTDSAEPQLYQPFFATRNPPPFDLAGSYTDSNVPWPKVQDDFCWNHSLRWKMLRTQKMSWFYCFLNNRCLEWNQKWYKRYWITDFSATLVIILGHSLGLTMSTKAMSPLIFILSPGADPGSNLYRFAAEMLGGFKRPEGLLPQWICWKGRILKNLTFREAFC